MAWWNGGNWSGIACQTGGLKYILSDLCRAVNERLSALDLPLVNWIGLGNYPTAADFQGKSLDDVASVWSALQSNIVYLIAPSMHPFAISKHDYVVWYEGGGSYVDIDPADVLPDAGYGSDWVGLYDLSERRAQNHEIWMQMQKVLDQLTCLHFFYGSFTGNAPWWEYAPNTYKVRSAEAADIQTAWDIARVASPSTLSWTFGTGHYIPPTTVSWVTGYDAGDPTPGGASLSDERKLDITVDAIPGVLEKSIRSVTGASGYEFTDGVGSWTGTGSTIDLESASWPALGAINTVTVAWVTAIPADPPTAAVPAVINIQGGFQRLDDLYVNISSELTDQS